MHATQSRTVLRESKQAVNEKIASSEQSDIIRDVDLSFNPSNTFLSLQNQAGAPLL